MRENRLHGSEGGAANARPYPYLKATTLTGPCVRGLTSRHPDKGFLTFQVKFQFKVVQNRCRG